MLMCRLEPVPAEANSSVPGRAFANAISSLTLRGGRERLPSRMFGSDTYWLTGAKSRTGSNGRFFAIAGWMVMLLIAVSSV